MCGHWDEIMGVGPKKEVITQIGFTYVLALLDIGWLNVTEPSVLHQMIILNLRTRHHVPRAVMKWQAGVSLGKSWHSVLVIMSTYCVPR